MIGAGQQRIGKYTLYKRLVSSKMGEAWIGYDPQSSSYVIIKIFYTGLQADSDEMLQFRQQTEQVAALQHPHIARIHDLAIIPSRNSEGSITSMVCLIMEYVEGQTLADYMQNTASRGSIRPGTEIVQLFTSVSLAIDDAHQHGIIHGNLKPTNVLLKKEGETRGQIGEPVLTDFGFLKLLGTDTVTTSPFYLSPEQIRGHAATERSDIYSLGVMLYELCTGVLPFRGSRPVSIMMQHLNTPPTPPALMNPTVSSALTNVILRALAKEPERRFPSASSMTVALAQALNLPIPESLSQARNISAILHEIESSNALQPLSPADVSPFSDSAPSRAYGAIAQRRPERSAVGANVPSAESEHRRKGIRSPWLLISMLVLLLASVGTIGSLLLFPQNTTKVVALNQLVGHAYFLNSGQFNREGPQGINDELQVMLSHVPDPPTGKSYYAWLLADKSVSESVPIVLGPLRVDHGNIQFLYRGDGQHTNLLGVISRFLITVEDAHHPTNSPLIDTRTWRYYAEIPEKPSPDDKLHFSMLDHLRHLLVESPELRIRGLHGGLAFWFARNTFAALEAANGAREASHNKESSTIRNQVIRVLDYLDGASFVQTEVPHGTPLLADASASQVALLGPSPTNPNPPGYTYGDEASPGYVYLISEHMGGAIESPQTTADQRTLAVQINQGLDREKSVLEQIHQDAKQLLSMNLEQLLQPAALSILNDLASQAQDAYTGQINPSNGQPEDGALWTYDNLQRLVTFDIQQYTSQTQ
jgi:serine/threonine protein kinase